MAEDPSLSTENDLARANSAPLLSARRLCKRFRNGGAVVNVLLDLDFDLEPGETVAIVGASGIGKSTLLHILGTLDRPDSGSLSINGERILDYPDDRLARFRNESIGFVFQFHWSSDLGRPAAGFLHGR